MAWETLLECSKASLDEDTYLSEWDEPPESDDDECLYEPTRAFLHSEHEPERGSHAAEELRLDKAEAMRSFVWLRESHPE